MGTKSIHVLLVEDDRFLSSMYEKKLTLEEFHVSIAHDGQQGIDIATRETPDIILLDILLPVKSGFEVLAELKKASRTKAIPVLILSNLSQQSDIRRCMDLGAEDYLIKSHFMPSEVIVKIREVLG